MAQPETTEARQEHRNRVLKGGTILTGVQNSEISCTIRNMNATGAELRVAPEARVPPEFLVYVPVDGTAYRCVTRWRKDGRVGVKFTGREPKPHWHYG